MATEMEMTKEVQEIVSIIIVCLEFLWLHAMCRSDERRRRAKKKKTKQQSNPSTKRTQKAASPNHLYGDASF